MIWFSYTLIFFRMVIAFTFGWSALRKLGDVHAFERAISGFRLLPTRLNRSVAVVLITVELFIAVMALFGGPMLFWVFIFACTILVGFCIVLATALVRRMKISCNCFGSSDKLVTHYDLWRNTGLILCALGGCGALIATQRSHTHVGLAEWGLIGISAIAFTIIWMHVEDIAQVIKGAF